MNLFPELHKLRPRTNYRQINPTLSRIRGKKSYDMTGFWWDPKNLKKRFDVINLAIADAENQLAGMVVKIEK